jgi:uncharacterized protein with WD repeat
MDIRLWDVRTRRLLRTLPLLDRANDGDSIDLKFTGDGKTLYAQGSGPGRVSVFDVATGKRLVHAQPESTTVSAFDISPDGKYLATIAGWDGRDIVLVEFARKEPAVVGRVASYVRDIAFSPDGEYLAWSEERDVRVWDVRARRMKEPLKALGPCALAYSPDGGYLVAGRKLVPLNRKLPPLELPVQPGVLGFSRTGGVLVTVPENGCTLLVIDPKRLEKRGQK